MRYILLAATALAMLSDGAYAETSNPNAAVTGNRVGNVTSSSNSAANASAGARSASRSAAVGNSSSTTISISSGTGTSAGASDPSGTTASEQYIGYGGGYTLRNTPEVQPPNVLGGNPCAVGASAGLSMAGFGIAGGATWADRACERRQQATLLFNMGEPKTALELMCQDDNVRSAMRVSGKPCAADIAAAQVPAAVPVAQVAAIAVAPGAAQDPAVARPDWCAKAAPTTEASKAYVAQVCGH
jgi:hypothetical protein